MRIQQRGYDVDCKLFVLRGDLFFFLFFQMQTPLLLTLNHTDVYLSNTLNKHSIQNTNTHVYTQHGDTRQSDGTEYNKEPTPFYFLKPYVLL